MSIERDRGLEWDAEGTLNNVTRWISGHDEGIVNGTRVVELFNAVASDALSLRRTSKTLPVSPAVQYQTPISIYQESLCCRRIEIAAMTAKGR